MIFIVSEVVAIVTDKDCFCVNFSEWLLHVTLWTKQSITESEGTRFPETGA